MTFEGIDYEGRDISGGIDILVGFDIYEGPDISVDFNLFLDGSFSMAEQE